MDERQVAIEEALAYARGLSRDADVRQRLSLLCPFCGVEPGEWCYSWKSERRSHTLHAVRVS